MSTYLPACGFNCTYDVFYLRFNQIDTSESRLQTRDSRPSEHQVSAA
jgi:hypothetical protein